MQIATDTSREPEINAGITDDGRGFITYFGDKPVYRSFELILLTILFMVFVMQI